MKLSNPPSIHSKRIQTRALMRRLDIQRIMHTKRFDEYVEIMRIQEQQDTNDEIVGVDRQGLIKMIQEKDVDGIYRVVKLCGYQGLGVLEECAVEVVQCLSGSLNMPRGILSLSTCCERSDLFVHIIFQTNICDQLVRYTNKLNMGSKQQTIYLYTLCEITHRTSLIQPDQIHSLFQLVQKLYEYSYVMVKEDNLVIRIIANITWFCQEQSGFSVQLFEGLTEKFWGFKNLVNVINVYAVCCNIVEKKLMKKSTKLMKNVIQIIIKGRQKIPQKCLVGLKPLYWLLSHLFQAFNENHQQYPYFFQQRIHNTTQQMTIHNYLLLIHRQTFQHFIRKQDGYNFLYEFSKNGPAEVIFQEWNKIGLLQQLISDLTSDNSICILSIKTLYNLIIHYESVDKSTFLQILETYNLTDNLNFVLTNYPQNQITKIILQILSYIQMR